MPSLIAQEDGSVRWDYDLPEDADSVKPGTKAALIAQAEGLGLSTEGTKAELEQRIAEATTESTGQES